MYRSTQKPPATHWQGLVQEVSAAAHHLVTSVEQIVAYNDWDLVPDEKVAVSDSIRELATSSGQTWLSELAAKIAAAPDCARQLERVKKAYSAYQPEMVLGGQAAPTAVVRDELRAALKAVQVARPRCPVELGGKIKVACIVGIQASVRQACPKPDPHAASLYRHFWARLEPIEPWFLSMAMGYNYSPGECEFGYRGGNFFVEPGFISELLEFAGPAWRAELAADVARLNGNSAGGVK